MEKTLSVSAIKEGTVIDHIPVGGALKILSLLKLNQKKSPVTVGLGLPSRTMGLKDLIKIQNRALTDQETYDIAVFAPDSTINIIRGYEIEKKIKPVLPKVIERILICPNFRCITRVEPIESAFFVEEYKNQIHLHCKYCEKVFERDEIKEYKT